MATALCPWVIVPDVSNESIAFALRVEVTSALEDKDKTAFLIVHNPAAQLHMLNSTAVGRSSLACFCPVFFPVLLLCTSGTYRRTHRFCIAYWRDLIIILIYKACSGTACWHGAVLTDILHADMLLCLQTACWHGAVLPDRLCADMQLCWLIDCVLLLDIRVSCMCPDRLMSCISAGWSRRIDGIRRRGGR
jgi:hypothetical protein